MPNFIFELFYIGSEDITDSETCKDISQHARTICVTNHYNGDSFCRRPVTREVFDDLLGLDKCSSAKFALHSYAEIRIHLINSISTKFIGIFREM